MSGPLPLRAALRRGALITAANWPVVLIEFSIESLFKLALAVPVIGGALMVAALIGADVGEVIAEGIRPTADVVFGFLASAPAALVCFLMALGVVALGGEIVMLVVKSCTLHILVHGERRAGPVESEALSVQMMREAQAFSLDLLLSGGQRYWRRAVTLALWLGAAYATIGSIYIAVVSLGVGNVGQRFGFGAGPLALLVATSAGVVGVTILNLVYDLVRVIVLTDDCRVSTAIGRLRRFLVEDARQVVGIFAVMSTVGMLAAAIALLATAGTTLVGSLPFLGLLLLPLQAAAWLVRGLVFQYLGLASLSAYQSQYRRFDSEGAMPPASSARDEGASAE
jgi:hypothetical protein